MAKQLKLNKDEKALVDNGHRIDAIKAIRLRTGCGLKEGLDATNVYTESKTKKSQPINKPGVREVGKNTVVIQHRKRSTQLTNICDEVQSLLKKYGNDNGAILPPDIVHKIDRYMEQVGIIANEVKKAEELQARL